MHKTAEVLVRDYEGKFPQTISELCTLPGIGRSTAGAILAAAWNRSAPILDANVRRVLSRYHGVNGPVPTKITEQKMWELAESHTPCQSSRDYNQGIMDFGATWCTLRNPKCNHCPISANCIAYQRDQVGEFPARKRRPIVHSKTTRPCVVFDASFDCLLRLRSTSGIFARMWDTPDVANRKPTDSLLTELKLPMSNLTLKENIHETTYRISNQKVSEELNIAKYNVSSMDLGTPLNMRWTPFCSISNIGISVRTLQRILLAKSLLESN